jgi:23S rRNA (cytosine1962-C5)-methyltransferase
MFLNDAWQDFEVLDTGSGEKLERWGGIRLIRPDPQVIWPPARPDLWPSADARYLRSDAGGGHWEFRRALPERWTLSLESPPADPLRFIVRPTGFKHTGLFPEQAANWSWMAQRILGAGRPIRVLNLFAYTGGATLACAAAGAHVVHVDAAKGMVAWAKENAALTGLPQDRVTWIIDDALKFVEREIRRGRPYDAILMDPPSFGRGPGGEVWKLEGALYPLAAACVEALSARPLFFLINSYTTGLQPAVLHNVLLRTVGARWGGRVTADELVLPVGTGGVLPCGASGRWAAEP